MHWTCEKKYLFTPSDLGRISAFSFQNEFDGYSGTSSLRIENPNIEYMEYNKIRNTMKCYQLYITVINHRVPLWCTWDWVVRSIYNMVNSIDKPFGVPNIKKKSFTILGARIADCAVRVSMLTYISHPLTNLDQTHIVRRWKTYILGERYAQCFVCVFSIYLQSRSMFIFFD